MRFFKVANVVAVHFATGIALSALSAASGASGLGFPKPGDEAAKTIRADFKAPPPGNAALAVQDGSLVLRTVGFILIVK